MRLTKLLLLPFPILSILAASILQGQADEGANPYTGPEDRAEGRRTFRIHCARCHGIDGAGGRGPDLTRGEYRHGETDGRLFENISRGIPNTGMPHHTLPGKRIWQTVTYLRAIAARPEAPALTGDPARGGELFRGKGDCLRCHRVEGSGGRLGPDLSDVGWRRSPDHLRTSILDPDAVVPRSHWTLRLRAGNGRVIQGIRLNEDSYSVQLMDPQENLLSLWKRDLVQLEHQPRSLMPGYRALLSGEEVEDLVAYLHWLGRRDDP